MSTVLNQGKTGPVTINLTESFTCNGPKLVSCNIAKGKVTVTWTFSSVPSRTEEYSFEPNSLRGNGFAGVVQLKIDSSHESAVTLERGV
jgi:hypothetical protein